MEKDPAVTEKSLPTSAIDYSPKDIASMVDIVLDIINSQVPQWDC